MKNFSHVDDQGNPAMVNVADKTVTIRRAVASARIRTTPEVAALIRSGGGAKGEVLNTARIAGIMAAKQTASLIPMCHPLPLDVVNVTIACGEDGVAIRAEAQTTAKTGVEMEAMTAAAVAALTVYDMCKSADKSMVIEQIRLEEKSGGKSGHFVRT